MEWPYLIKSRRMPEPFDSPEGIHPAAAITCSAARSPLSTPPFMNPGDSSLVCSPVNSRRPPSSGVPAAVIMPQYCPTSGALKLPFDLAPLGAPLCFVWNDIVLPLAAVTNAAGDGKFTLPIPASAGNIRVYFHWFNYDPTANKFGWTTSSQLKLLLGS